MSMECQYENIPLNASLLLDVHLLNTLCHRIEYMNEFNSSILRHIVETQIQNFVVSFCSCLKHTFDIFVAAPFP